MATRITIKGPADPNNAVSQANANTLHYKELAYSQPDKKLYCGSGTTDTYSVFISEGEDNSYIKANNNAVKAPHINWGDSSSDATKVDTDVVVEGDSNLYFTNTRADARVANASLTAHHDVNPVNVNDDGKVLSYDHANGDFTWVAAPGNTDENVSTANLLAKLALLDNSSPIQIGDAANTTVVIEGNLQVKGSVDTVSETNLEVLDKTVTVAKGSADGSVASGAGLVVDCGSATDSSLQWVNSGTIGGAGSQRFWSVADSLRIAAQAGVVARLEVAGTGDSVLTMTNVLGGSTNVITGGAWTGDAIADGKIASSGTWNTAAGWGDHGAAGYLTSETSHADVVVDGDFDSDGILERTSAGNYDTIPYLAANRLKGLHDPSNFGTAGQLLTSEASAGFSWTDVGTGASDVAAGNHNHNADYSAVNHTHSGSDIISWLDGESLDGGSF